MRAFRIGDKRLPIFDGTGASMHGGRWNSPGRPVIYAAQTYAGALLETMVHTTTDHLPRNHAFITIEIPDDLRQTVIGLEGIHLTPQSADAPTQTLGDAWLDAAESCILLVPSFVLHGRENNILINPLYADFNRLKASQPEPVTWDARLFARTAR